MRVIEARMNKHKFPEIRRIFGLKNVKLLKLFLNW